MSSSIFIEPSGQDGKEEEKPDSNLVVVYGKNGVNIDPKDLETLIEEKAVQSISVIRISSPTPSMEEAEEAVRLEAAKEAQENATDSDESTDAESNDAKRRDTTADNIASSSAESALGENSSDTGEDVENYDSSESDSKCQSAGVPRRNRNTRRNAIKNKNKSRAKKQEIKQNTEVMGLTLEGFYEAEAALEIAKEACKMAGIPYIRNTAEYEFMLFVIRNDHCYTPFTSPEQMKAKLAAEKLETEKLAANTRKIQPQLNIPTKQIITKPKRLPIAPNVITPLTKLCVKKPMDEVKLRTAKERTQQSDNKVDEVELRQQKSSHATDDDDDDEIFELIDVEDSDYTGSDQSAESDNDRDSDLDFNVNNRQSKKRRIPLVQRKARRLISVKMQEKRTQQANSQDERPLAVAAAPPSIAITVSPSTSGAITTTQRPLMLKSRIMSNNVTINSRQIKIPQITSITKVHPVTAGSTGTAIAAKTISAKVFAKPAVSTAAPLRPGQIVQISDKTIATTSRNTVVKNQPATQPAVKEIVINKVLSSPKGCFTELTTLISEAEKSTNPATTPTTTAMQSQPVTPTSSTSRNPAATPGTPSRTCFMRIDASAKNTLPSRISVETHQSSSELLAAEHDKQLDLIDSIVTDEMNKSLDNISEKPSISIDENIPKLVQMLENTEKALESNNLVTDQVAATNTLETCMDTSSNVHTNTNTNVDDIDISHDLPEDLLQHVVELIKDDKTLQEAVEKEILEQENNFNNDALSTPLIQQAMQQQLPKATTSSHSNVRTIQLMQQPLAQRSPPFMSTLLPTTTSKSIIQMSISNTTSSSPGSVTANSNILTRSSPLTRRDPIQIVRGNGRVITLPPIEAPTTRAKRRAQVVPNSEQPSAENSPQIMNESSLDSSMHSNTSLNAMTTVTPTASVAPTEAIGSSVEKKSRELPAKRRTSKEGSAVSKSAKKSAASRSNAAKRSAANSKQEDTEASESQGDDDDPKRLWCICRQPHNNRFMICCDACADWFHGTCVNVTKAMGREMEQKGIEWSCPQCNKKREERSQRKLTDMLQVRRTNSQSSSDEKVKTPVELKPLNVDMPTSVLKKETVELKKVSSTQPVVAQTPTPRKTPIVVQGQKKVIATTPTASVSSQIKAKVILTTPVRTVTSTPNVVTKQVQPQINRTNTATGSTAPNPPTVAPATPCVLCKKAARPKTIYCSDECIRRSAQNAINAYTAKSTEQSEVAANNSNTIDDKRKKAKGLFEDLLSMADRKPKVERIMVYDRKSGTKLSGNHAPTTLTIKKWLHDNPSFEVVLPGSQLSIDLEKQHQQQRFQVTPKQVGQIRASNLKIVTPPTTNRANLPTSPGNKSQISSTSKESGGVQNAVSPPPVKTVKQIIDDHKNISGSGSSSRPSTPRQLQKYPQHVQIRPDNKSPRNETKDEMKSKDRQLKRQSSDVSTGSNSSNKKSVDSATSSTATSSDSEPIRKNVRRTLKEQILQRMNETHLQSPNDAGHEAPISTNQFKLTSQEVEDFVKATEEELFNMFNRDTGIRYKSKYRSLIFNIKDRKNHTLFAKICAKQIDPKQLVHLTPEELASQELAQWRQNENKHQLEMIKKSELDLLSCTKNYLFKNHKGEEVIESKESDVCVNLDMTIPVEDVVNVLNNSAVSSVENEEDTTEISGSDSGLKQHISPLLSTGSVETHEYHAQHVHEHHHHYQQQQQEGSDEKIADEKSKSTRNESEKERESRGRDRRNRSKSRDSEKDRERERRHRSKSKDSEKERERSARDKHHRSRERHHRDKSRSRRRSHSRSKSRSRSEEKRNKGSSISNKEERRDREKEREREREKDRDYDKERERKEKKIVDNKFHVGSNISTKTSTISQVQSKEKHRNSPTAAGSAKHKPIIQQQKSMECFNLIDQIIESSKTVEEAANLVRDTGKEKVREKEKPKEQQSPVIATSSTSEESSASAKATVLTTQYSSTADSDQEPSSTVSIPTPPHDSYAGEEASFSRSGSPNFEATQIWAGGLSMNEVASLRMKLHHLIGNSRNIGKYLPDNLDVVGRIDGKTVWEYLWKIRKSPNKEIVLLRLMPYGEDDTNAYEKLFQYLDQKKRLGVIKSMTPQIKDFYIYPLESGDQLPKVLQVTNHEDFYNDPYRSDMIIGIIVRVLGKRMPAPIVSSVPVPVSATAAKLARHNRNEAESFTPPGSPKRRKRSHKSDIDIDAIIKAPIVAKTVKKPTAMNTDADEPYSPGGSSDDDVVPQYSGKSSSSLLLGLPSADEDLKRKMEEINRQIAAQEMEIAGLLNVEPTASASVLANISIPSNLPQILASIKNKDIPVRGAASTQSLGDRLSQVSGTFAEYNPEDAICSSYNSSARHSLNPPSTSSSSTSRLAQLSEAELLSMVPDDIMLDPTPTSSSKKSTILTNVSPYYQEPPPPGI